MLNAECQKEPDTHGSGLLRVLPVGFIVLVTLAPLTVSIPVLGTKQTKPVETEIIYTYFKGAPGSLSDMITAADAVVTGTIVAGSSHDPDRHLPRGRGGRVSTLYRFKVREVIHALGGHPVDDIELTIRREGGRSDRGSYVHEVVQDGFPQFEQDAEYLLFLRWDPAAAAWAPAFGPDSVVAVKAGKVEAFGTSAVLAAYKGKNATELIERIRRYGRQ